MRTTASRCCSWSTVPNAPPRASTFSCGADDRAVTSSPLPRGSGVRSTCTGTPAARAVATAATWSLPDRASTVSPVRGVGGPVTGRSGTSSAIGPTGGAALPAAVGAVAGAVTVSSAGLPRSSPATASVRVVGSTARASRSSTLTSPPSDSGAAGTTRVPAAFCAAQSWAPCPTARTACGASRVTSSLTAVASAGSADAAGVSSIGAPRATAAEAAPAWPPASPSAARTTTGAPGRARRWPPPRAARERWGPGRSPDRWVPRAGATPRSSPGPPPSRCSRRGRRRTPSTRLPPVSASPVYAHPEHAPALPPRSNRRHLGTQSAR